MIHDYKCTEELIYEYNVRFARTKYGIQRNNTCKSRWQTKRLITCTVKLDGLSPGLLPHPTPLIIHCSLLTIFFRWIMQALIARNGRTYSYAYYKYMYSQQEYSIDQFAGVGYMGNWVLVNNERCYLMNQYIFVCLYLCFINAIGIISTSNQHSVYHQLFKRRTKSIQVYSFYLDTSQ